MKARTIDLKNKSMAEARRAVKRIQAFKKEHGITRPVKFLLPDRRKPVKRSGISKNEYRSTRCPYCQSPLVETEMGIVCTGENLRDIAFEINYLRRKYGDKADMYISTRANRFYDVMVNTGQIECDYIMGNEERRWRINNRILRAGVDRKKIFNKKK